MKQLFRTTALVLMGLVAMSAPAWACTGMYVGKDVSEDGTTVIARSEDQGGGAYNKMFKVEPAKKEKGRFFVDTGEGMEKFKVPLPEKTYKYTYLLDSSDAGDGLYPASCTNSYGVSIVGTISADPSDKYLESDPFVDIGLREAILPGLIACQVKTSREAVDLLAKLVDKYGSSEGNILFFADNKEAWIFEIYGGHTYAAMKMPTDMVSLFGNQFMIGAVDQQDKDNYVFSKNLFATIDKVGAVKDGEQYNLAKSVSDNKRDDYSNLRTWMGKKILAPENTGDYEKDNFYPLFYKPDKKVKMQQVFDMYRNRYQDTPYAMDVPEKSEEYNAMLARMNEEDPETPGIGRPIGVTRSSDIHAIQIFDKLPKKSNSIQWLCMGNAEGSVFVPAFSGITDTNKAYQVDGSGYNTKSAYWIFKRNDTLANSDRDFLGKGVKSFWQYQEEMMHNKMLKQVNKVKSAYDKDPKEGSEYVTKLANDMTNEQLGNAKLMYNALMYTATDNINDRGENFRKTEFVAPIDLETAAKGKGYKVQITDKDDSKRIVLSKGSKKYTFKSDSDKFTFNDHGKKSKGEFTFAPYAKGDKIIVPFDFIAGLK